MAEDDQDRPTIRDEQKKVKDEWKRLQEELGKSESLTHEQRIERARQSREELTRPGSGLQGRLKDK